MLRFRKTFVPQVDMMDCGVAALASLGIMDQTTPWLI